MRVVGHQYPGQEDGVAQRRAGSESRRRCACRLEPGEYAATPMGGCCDVVDVMRDRCTPATQGAMPWRAGFPVWRNASIVTWPQRAGYRRPTPWRVGYCGRADEGRVGTEGVRSCRSWWARD